MHYNPHFPLPYYFLVDEAFPLRTDIIRSYGKSSGSGEDRKLTSAELMFNYRLSRGRRMVENVFGILTQRFYLYQRKLQLNPEFATTVIKATVILHNFLTREKDPMTCEVKDAKQVPPAHGMKQLVFPRGNRGSKAAIFMSNFLTGYYASPAGKIPWQKESAQQ